MPTDAPTGSVFARTCLAAILKDDVTRLEGSRITLVLEHISGIAGVDEAGRGPLAGPVVAAAAILPVDFDLNGLNDSKKVPATKREELASRIKSQAIWAIALCSPEEIDRLNILQASMLAMERAVELLKQDPSEILVDGNRIPKRLRFPARCIIKGDGKIAAIAAASILAKTHRDALMVQYAGEYPQYNFERNFGYPTPDHFEALKRFGPCPIHRRSFSPVAECDPARPRNQLCLTFDE